VNIFITDIDPVISAQNLDDKRVIKMILESAQMLCTALRMNNGTHLAKYKATHANHPSNVWARQTDSNYDWLLRHFKALCDEYTHRFNKVHASESLYTDLVTGKSLIPSGSLTPFANCAARSDMGLDFKHIIDVPLAYQTYLLRRFANDKLPVKWTKRTDPAFVIANRQPVSTQQGSLCSISQMLKDDSLS
jgi:hypothetical protein